MHSLFSTCKVINGAFLHFSLQCNYQVLETNTSILFVSSHYNLSKKSLHPEMGTGKKKKKSCSEDIRQLLRGVRRLRPPEAEENTIFSTLKMQLQGLLTHTLLGFSTNATPKFTRQGKSLLFFLYLSNNRTSFLCWKKIIMEKKLFYLDNW